MASNNIVLTAESLLAGEQARFEIPIPAELTDGEPQNREGKTSQKIVILKPLTIGSYLLILKAAKEDPALIPLLMIKESMSEPKLSLDQVKKLRIGLVEYLVNQIKIISGIKKKSP